MSYLFSKKGKGTQTVSFEINIDDVVNGVDNRQDAIDLVKELMDKFCMSESDYMDATPMEISFNKSIDKLRMVYASLSNEDQSVIGSIANKY